MNSFDLCGQITIEDGTWNVSRTSFYKKGLTSKCSHAVLKVTKVTLANAFEQLNKGPQLFRLYMADQPILMGIPSNQPVQY